MTPNTPFTKFITIVMDSTNGIQGARHTKHDSIFLFPKENEKKIMLLGN